MSAVSDAIMNSSSVGTTMIVTLLSGVLIVRAPQLRDGERLGVLGADKALGVWDVQKILPMTAAISPSSRSSSRSR